MRPLLFGSGKDSGLCALRGISPSASMRPLLFGSGKSWNRSGPDSSRRRRFNEAAAFRQRKRALCEPIVPTGVAPASMRPLLFGSGKGPGRAVSQFVVLASMRPLLFGSGKRRDGSFARWRVKQLQ